MVAAGIDYVIGLKQGILAGSPVVINMSLGGPDPSPMIEEAIDRAIEAGVIVVAAAGNAGTDGMDYPGAYSHVISVGASGWTQEWLIPGDGPFYRLWWLQSGFFPYEDIPEPTPDELVYVANFSSRELSGQYLDVLAPGSWVRGPYPGYPGYSHLPWWSKGIGDMAGWNPGNFYYVGGTSMATPHVVSVAALMLEKNPSLTQGEIETILKDTALPIPPGSVDVFFVGLQVWDSDAAGDGLIQADAAVGLVPVP
jgi:subtilisin family serine protease